MAKRTPAPIEPTTVQLNIPCPAHIHRALRLAAADLGVTQKDLILSTLAESLGEAYP